MEISTTATLMYLFNLCPSPVTAGDPASNGRAQGIGGITTTADSSQKTYGAEAVESGNGFLEQIEVKSGYSAWQAFGMETTSIWERFPS